MEKSSEPASGSVPPDSAILMDPVTRIHPRRHQSYTPQQWKDIRKPIKEIYIDKNETLVELMERLAKEHDFHPTKRMLKIKFTLWGFHKNITKKSASSLLDRDNRLKAGGKISILGTNGRAISERRCKNYLRRRKTSSASSQSASGTPSTNANSTSTARTSPVEPMKPSDSSANTLSKCDEYEQECRYHQWEKKFRYSETFFDNTTYQWDSFGYGSSISVNEEKQCTTDCLCRKQLVQEAFAFEIHKSNDRMSITIYSDLLYGELAPHLVAQSEQLKYEAPPRTFDGLALLGHYHSFAVRANTLRQALHSSPGLQSLALEMDLFVNGFLGVGQIFQSLGYENLYEMGHLTYELWKLFQKQKLDDDITNLDDRFCLEDDNEEGQPSPQSKFVSPTTAKALPGGAFETAPEDTWETLFEGDEALTTWTLIDFSEYFISYRKLEVDIETHLLCLDSANDFAPSETLLADTMISECNMVQHITDEDTSSLASRLNIRPHMSNAEMDEWEKENGVAFLQAALIHGEGIVRYLLDCESEVRLGWRDALLLVAAKAGHWGGIAQLLIGHLREQELDADMHRFWIEAGCEIREPYLYTECYSLLKSPAPEKSSYTLAEQAGHIRVAKLVLDFEASASPESEIGEILLYKAIKTGQEGMVRLLLEYRVCTRPSSNFIRLCPYAAVDDGILRLFLDYGAGLSKTLSLAEPMLCVAAKAGSEGIMSLLLDHDARPPSSGYYGGAPLLVAAEYGHEGTVRLLLEQRGRANMTSNYDYASLVAAAKRGHEGTVRLLLEHRFDPTSSSPFGGPPLYEAAKAGHERVVRMILGQSVEVDGMDIWSSAVNFGVKRFDACGIRELVRCGMNVQLAALYLRGENHSRRNWFLRVAASTFKKGFSDASGNVRCLRLNFVRQYNLLKTATQNSQTTLQFIPQRFQYYRQAWAAGIATMRGLSRGIKPPGVCETLAFLMLGKAIVETLFERKGYDYSKEFEQDLELWGLLLEKDADFYDYEEALLSMWGLTFERLYLKRCLNKLFGDGSRSSYPYSEPYPFSCFSGSKILVHCQELASVLVGHANDLFGFENDDDRGLEHSDHPQPQHHDVLVDNQIQQSQQHHPPKESSSFQAQPEPVPLQHLDGGTLQDKIKNDTAPFEPVVVLLVTGAIFGIIIIFLQVLQWCALSFPLPPIKTLQERAWVLEAYMGLSSEGTAFQVPLRIGVEEDVYMNYEFSM